MINLLVEAIETILKLKVITRMNLALVKMIVPTTAKVNVVVKPVPTVIQTSLLSSSRGGKLIEILLVIVKENDSLSKSEQEE